MQATLPVSSFVPALSPRIRPRTALVASADRSFRQRLQATLTGLRWQVREAENGAQAWAEAQTALPEAIIVDSWLPDLDLAEFLKDFQTSFPKVDVVTAEGTGDSSGTRSPYRQELLYALRQSQDTDTAAWNAAPDLGDSDGAGFRAFGDARKSPVSVRPDTNQAEAQPPVLVAICLLYTSPSPRDRQKSRMPSSA